MRTVLLNSMAYFKLTSAGETVSGLGELQVLDGGALFWTSLNLETPGLSMCFQGSYAYGVSTRQKWFLKGMRLLSQGETSIIQCGLFLFAHRLATASIPAAEEHLWSLTRQVPSVVYGCPMNLNV